MRPILAALFAAPLSMASFAALAAETNVAVAANFTEPAKEIAAAFEAKTGDKAILSFGSTGKLATQIEQGGPFHVLLAADDTTPGKLIDKGFGVADSRFTYATGKLVLWSKSADAVKGEDALTKPVAEKIAIANPETAPYGAAAVETMTKLGVYEALKPRLVQGDSIAQTYQFVETGNAEIGFVALSQIIKKNEGSRWDVPADMYEPIHQDAVLVKAGADDAVAKAFLAFLKSPEALKIIESYGYQVAAQ